MEPSSRSIESLKAYAKLHQLEDKDQFMGNVSFSESKFFNQPITKNSSIIDQAK